MEELLQTTRCDCKSIVWIPSADQWVDREKDTGHGCFLQTFCHDHQLLEPVYRLGRVRSEFPLSAIYWTHSLPVHARIPATLVSLERTAIECSCGGLLVLRGRENLGRSTPPSSTSYAQAQNDSRPSTIRLTSVPTWTEGPAVHNGHQIVPAL